MAGSPPFSDDIFIFTHYPAVSRGIRFRSSAQCRRCCADAMLADGMEDEDMIPSYSRASDPTKTRLNAEMKSGEQLEVHDRLCMLEDCNTVKHAQCCGHGHFDRALCLGCLRHLSIYSTVCECGIYHLKCHCSCSTGAFCQ